jgi:hypothetical protein
VLVFLSVSLVSLLVSLLELSVTPVSGVLRNNQGSSSEWLVHLPGSDRLLTWDAQILILIFAEVLGLYGLIVALIMNTKADGVSVVCPLRNSSVDPAFLLLDSATNGRGKSNNGVEISD